jgi:hypothetical protein
MHHRDVSALRQHASPRQAAKQRHADLRAGPSHAGAASTSSSTERLPPTAVKRISDVLALAQQTPVLASREEVVRVATKIASAKRELMFSTVSMDRPQYQLVFLRQWLGHLGTRNSMHTHILTHTARAHTHTHVYIPAGARARNVLLVGANEATCTVARQAAVACFVDGASPKQSGKQNGFGTQVVTKWWYAMVISQAGFHLLFSDPDIVWLKDPFQHWDRSFDFQVRAQPYPYP